MPEPQHVAFATDDIVATVQRLHAAGAPLLSLPANYADDLEARFDLPPHLLAAIREHELMYEEDADGSYLHVATEVLGDRVFFEVVQRLGRYGGYGTADLPVRMAAQRRARVARSGQGGAALHDGRAAPPVATGIAGADVVLG